MKTFSVVLCLLMLSSYASAVSVFFEEHADTLEAEELLKLDSLAQEKTKNFILKAYDNSEGPSFNSQMLRFSRSAEVRALLLERGIPPHRIQIDEEPSSCRRCTGKKARRVDLMIKDAAHN